MNDRELVLEAVREMPEAASLREIADGLQTMAALRERMENNPDSENGFSRFRHGLQSDSDGRGYY